MAKSLLELRHLRTLKTIAQTGNLSDAANVLHLTQSALSHQIKALENFYQLKLIDRKQQPLKLTTAGSILLDLANAVLPNIEEAERRLARLQQGEAGQLRIAVECHTCFDWLMPAMDDFRAHWPEVELDIVSGFHSDPVSLLLEYRADLAIVSEQEPQPDIAHMPLFRHEIIGLIASDHELNARDFLTPEDFADQTLISYPVPDQMLDVVQKFLLPANINPKRRTSELTIALLQLVASRRGIAALPFWAVTSYLQRGYIQSKKLGQSGIYGELYAAIRREDQDLAFMEDFLHTIREISAQNLARIELLPLTQK